MVRVELPHSRPLFELIAFRNAGLIETDRVRGMMGEQKQADSVSRPY